LEQEGGFLFRWRGVLPLLLIPLVLPALPDSEAVERLLGDRPDHLWAYGCMALSFAGLAIRCATVGFAPAGTSGRNARRQRASMLNTTGLYSVVRNPLYLGNLLITLGLALVTMVWWLVVIVILAYWLYIERIIAAEERFLAERFGAAYATWADRTPAFWPRLANWRPPAERFSLRTVLRKEYNGLMTIALAYVGLEASADLLVDREPLNAWLQIDYAWVLLLAIALPVCAVLWLLNRHTRLLHVAGR
jgi:protein-S-isoprenylcysteine O-methyltransferase Ste14